MEQVQLEKALLEQELAKVLPAAQVAPSSAAAAIDLQAQRLVRKLSSVAWFDGAKLRLQLAANDVAELQKDGWDGGVWDQAANGLGLLHDGLLLDARKGGVVRRAAQVAKLVATAFLKHSESAEAQAVEQLETAQLLFGSGTRAHVKEEEKKQQFAAAQVIKRAAERRSRLGGAIACPLELSETSGEGKPVRRRFISGCGSPRHECLAHFAVAKKRPGAAHCTVERRKGTARRSRSAAGLQVGFQRVMCVMQQHLHSHLLGGCTPMQLLAMLPDEALLPLMLNVALGMLMHDREAAESMGIKKGSDCEAVESMGAKKGSELAAVNGVGGGHWDEDRCSAWCTNDYPLIDAVMLGVDDCSAKWRVAEAYGYKDFAEMCIKEADTLRACLDDLPAEGDPGAALVYNIRLDVASPAFIFVWAMVLERPVPSLVDKSVHDVKQLSLATDYFAACDKLVTAILFVKADGGFGNKPRWGLCIVGIVVLIRVELERSRRVRYVERCYELPQAFRGKRQAHGTGSHLFMGMLPRSLPDYEALVASGAKTKDVRFQMQIEMDRRREDARVALEAKAFTGTWDKTGAQCLDVASLLRVRFDSATNEEYNEAGIFAAWLHESIIERSMLDAAELRRGFDDHVKAHVMPLTATAKCRAVRARLITEQEERLAPPPPVGPVELAPAEAGDMDEDSEEEMHDEGVARTTKEGASEEQEEEEEMPHEWFEEMRSLRHERIEVLYLKEHEEDDGKGEWWAGKVGASVSRWRGLQVVFDREPREPPTYFTDIIMATEGSLWRHEVKRIK